VSYGLSCYYKSQAKQLQKESANLPTESSNLLDTTYITRLCNIVLNWQSNVSASHREAYSQAKEKLDECQVTQGRFVSYRPSGAKSGEFIDLDILLTSGNYSKIKKVYDGIFLSVTHFEPSEQAATSLSTFESELHQKLLELRPGNQKSQTEKHEAFQKRLSAFANRSQPKTTVEKPNAIVEIEGKRQADPKEELKRLNKIPSVQKLLSSIQSQLDKKPISTEALVAIGHSQELKEALSDTHYVFNHGQNMRLYTVVLFSKMIKKIFEAYSFDSYTALRHRNPLEDIADEKDIDYFIKELVGGFGLRVSGTNRWIALTDNHFSKQLLSADFLLDNTTRCESAISFFALNEENVAIKDNRDFDRQLLTTIAKEYIEQEDVVKALVDFALNLINPSSKEGNLYTICVPKEEFDESCYFSQPLGKSVEPSRKLACRNHLDGGTEMQIEENLVPPQVRILANKLDPTKNFYLEMHSTASQESLDTLADQMKDGMLAALSGPHVFDAWKKST
jgi:hypothetical protein